jgi:hypothetical protein
MEFRAHKQKACEKALSKISQATFLSRIFSQVTQIFRKFFAYESGTLVRNKNNKQPYTKLTNNSTQN